jgi:hypothetical protein
MHITSASRALVPSEAMKCPRYVCYPNDHGPWITERNGHAPSSNPVTTYGVVEYAKIRHELNLYPRDKKPTYWSTVSELQVFSALYDFVSAHRETDSMHVSRMLPNSEHSLHVSASSRWQNAHRPRRCTSLHVKKSMPGWSHPQRPSTQGITQVCRPRRKPGRECWLRFSNLPLAQGQQLARSTRSR